MSDAIIAGLFAISASSVGLTGVILANIRVIRRDREKTREDAAGTAIADFVTAVTNLRLASQKLDADRTMEDRRVTADDRYGLARSAYDRLGVVTADELLQWEARKAIHHGYWMTQAPNSVRVDEQRELLIKHLDNFKKLARKELGIKNPDAFLSEREEEWPPPAWAT